MYSVLWKLSFENIDADSFASDIKKSVVDKAKKTREVYNYKKDEWRSSRNPFKKFGSLFMSETKTETYYEDGYYETTDLVRSLDTYLRNLQTESDAMANSFREIMDDGKKKVRDLTNRLLKEIQQFLNDISLYQVSKIIYDKNENTQDKLTTVYSTIFSLQNYGLAMLLNGNKDHVDLYLGVVTRNLLMRQKSPEEVLNEDNMQQDGEVPSVDNESTIKLSVIEKNLLNTGKVLKNAFIGNFPGTELKMVNNVTEKDKGIVGKADIIRESLKEAKYITAVSSVPAIRNANESKNLEFIQGLEKLIETMRGKKYSMIIIADAMSNDKIEEMCAEYEDIYSQLAPFKTSAQTINAQATQTDTEGLVKGITDTTNETIAKSLTHGTATAKTHTDSAGGSIGTGRMLLNPHTA